MAGNRGSGFARPTRNEEGADGGDSDSLAQSLVRDYAKTLREIQSFRGKTWTTTAADGNLTLTPEGMRVQELNAHADQLDLRLQALGLDVMGLPLEGDDNTLSAATSASLASAAADRSSREAIAALERDSAERINRERIASEELRTKQTLESNERVSGDDREQRRQAEFLSSLNDILDAEIERGNLSVREAEQRRQAAYQSAEIKLDATKHFAGYALPAGTQFYPGLEPGGVLSSLLGGFSMPTLGGQTIDPNQFGDPITASLAGMAGVDMAGQAIQNAQAGQQALGVPSQLYRQPQARVSAPPMDPVAALLASGG